MSAASGKLSTEQRGLILGTVVLVALAAWWSWSAQGRAEAAQRRLRSVERSWQVLSLSEPLPTTEVAADWAARREALQEAMADGRKRLGGKGDDPLDVPVGLQRAEAFFTLAQFAQAQREQAAAAGVVVPEGYALGFSAYANSGPQDADLPIVLRQYRLVEALLGTVWSSGARELTRVQREVPARKREDAANDRGVRGEGRAEDYLEWPAAQSLARDGLWQTLAVRVGFVGTTETLRQVLDAVQALPLPLVVRAVEVEPLGEDGTARGGVRSLADLFRNEEGAADAGAEATGRVAIIRATEAEFLITVEYIEFVDTATAGEGDAA
ncbi:Amuc_1100 family pilus-like protein [Actomonas aquatica]|uniref:Amuc_1100 family pilus-like protein n=1 Tax=Actomonas aquatica TaxID=2866162 RepID=A0ABZ1C8M0_9BACT|nr:Amuc_1100 family pilus-like protein [Opitutus sp. WL0086]WRQ87725.1 Amuc_1100 family pilus-like protein [Opitutus sp. WL0086]